MSGSGMDGGFRKSARPQSFSDMLGDYLPGDGDLGDKQSGEPGANARESAGKLPVQARIDLHGLTLEAARKAVDVFLKDARTRGLRKVMIIHGKGLHSGSGEAVLRKGILVYLEGHPLAGKRQHASREDGGSGALYVFIKGSKT